MTFANPLPWWALVLVVSAAALVAWQAYRRFGTDPRRRAALSTLRFLTLLLLVLFLMRPVASRSEPGARDAIVPILVDTSRSMSIEDADGARRLDRARDVLTSELLPALDEDFQVEVLSFGDGVEPAAPGSLSATGRRSDLAGALADVRERFRGRPVAGIVLISDGGDTSGSAEAATVGADQSGSAPIYALGIGSPTVGRDREVTSVTAAEAVLDESRVDLAVSAVSHGDGGRAFELRLLENGRPIEVRRVTPAGDGVPVREVFQVSPPREAPTVYTVEIPVGPGELVPENNARSTLVLPPARTRRVLLVEGAPGFEHAFIKRALAQDRGLEVDAAVRHGRNEQGQDTFYIQAAARRSQPLDSGFPRGREDLFVYDAVVLANVEGRQLGSARMELLRAFVAERGGGLLVLGAQSFLGQGLLGTPVEEVLPLDLTGRNTAVLPASSVKGLNRVALTGHGATHPVMQIGAGGEETLARWDAMPPLAAIAPLGGPRPGATVLAVTGGPGGAPRALVAVQRYGEGRSMAFTGEATWRWRMMLPSTDRGFERFWRQALRWLALPAADAVTVQAGAGGSPGDTLPVTVLVRNAAYEGEHDATVDVQVTAPDGRLETLRAADAGSGRYTARFRPEQPGVYRLTAAAGRGTLGTPGLGTASTAMLVGGSDLEMTDPRLNLQLLQRLTLASGGRLVAPGDASDLAASLRDAVPAASLAVRRDLWHNAWSFSLVVLLLGAEWGLRRRWGLR
ncbi:MAG TPA: glutamine amidotransferase [Thermohalobaculum sp.]|nr:glutamine amidotransferase [Thermohalobaculum sp.]